MSSPGKKQLKKWTKSNHSLFQQTKPAKRYLGDLLRLWVQIPLEAWMFVVSVVCCQLRLSAMS
jgi:hypothetical protein